MVKTAAELAMEKTDDLVPPAALVDARPKRPDDEPTIEQEGAKVFAVSRRPLLNGAVLEARERLPNHLGSWDKPRQRAYLIEVSRRLKADLNRQEASPPVRPNRKARRQSAVQQRFEMREAMSQVLSDRLDTLHKLVEQVSRPEFYGVNRENFGHANGLRRAAAVMVGRAFVPLKEPEAFPAPEALPKGAADRQADLEPDQPALSAPPPAKKGSRKK